MGRIECRKGSNAQGDSARCSLALFGFWFTSQQNAHLQQLEDQRAEAERDLAEQRAQDEALQAYLNQMSTLLLEKDLRDAKRSSDVRRLAQARTLTVLRQLSPDRKTEAMNFLIDSELVFGEDPIIDLSGSDLSGVDMGNERVTCAGILTVTGEGSHDIDTRGCQTGLDLSYTDLNNADLREANLSNTYFREANLSYANLKRANLRGGTVYDADLTGAVLTKAQVTDGQLEEAKYLHGATMPNGQKYEDWLKSKGSGEDGENIGAS